jgi:hypothetical protein
MAAGEKESFKGVRPRINEAHEFIEIAKNFKRPQEFLREAISNSWDAQAGSVSITMQPITLPGLGPGRRKQRLNIQVWDDGDGMGRKEIEYFFSLGESHKPKNAIGSKGHGTKMYYRSGGIRVVTHQGGSKIVAKMDAPWEHLTRGHVPLYDWELEPNPDGARGTTINIDAFDVLPKEFEDLNEVLSFLQWNTICGSVAEFLGAKGRSMKVTLRLPGAAASPTVETGFTLPAEQTNLAAGTSDIVKFFDLQKGLDCGETSTGDRVVVDFRAILLGDSARKFIPKTYEQTGLWLCKDYILIERFNEIIEDVAGGEYWYRSFLGFANSQQFDLTANRNEIQSDEAWELARAGITKAFEKVWNDQFTKDFFEAKRKEDEKAGIEKKQAKMQRRFEEFNDRPSLAVKNPVPGLLPKSPRNEAETTLVLQALISAGVKGIDFKLVEYDAHEGTDALVEYQDKGIPHLGWMEVVRTLPNLFAWGHDFGRIHKVVCWSIGKMKAEYPLEDGGSVRYQVDKGKHSLLWKKANGDQETIPVYVLGEILGAEEQRV